MRSRSEVSFPTKILAPSWRTLPIRCGPRCHHFPTGRSSANSFKTPSRRRSAPGRLQVLLTPPLRLAGLLPSMQSLSPAAPWQQLRLRRALERHRRHRGQPTKRKMQGRKPRRKPPHCPRNLPKIRRGNRCPRHPRPAKPLLCTTRRKAALRLAPSSRVKAPTQRSLRPLPAPAAQQSPPSLQLQL